MRSMDGSDFVVSIVMVMGTGLCKYRAVYQVLYRRLNVKCECLI